MCICGHTGPYWTILAYMCPIMPYWTIWANMHPYHTTWCRLPGFPGLSLFPLVQYYYVVVVCEGGIATCFTPSHVDWKRPWLDGAAAVAHPMCF